MLKLVHLIKGFVIGIATLVPGVSGGTMSIILGVYDDMIRAVSSFFKDVKKNTIFLTTLSVGGILGIVTFSKMIDYCLVNFKLPTIYLFLGIIIGSMPVLLKKTTAGKKNNSDVLYFLLGILIILVMSLYNGTIVNLADSKGLLNFMFLFLAGIIIAVALILPGISTSFMLLALGLYDITLRAINNVELNYLIPIAIGGLFGVVTTTKILENLLNNKPRPTYMLILGFVLGSIVEVFPGLPTGLDIVVSFITFGIGFVTIKYVSEKYDE